LPNHFWVSCNILSNTHQTCFLHWAECEDGHSMCKRD
jgi:hypothetical protein